MNYWLVKSDPEEYSWDDLHRDRKTSWDGIRNYAARNHMRNMKKGDTVLVYHSGGESAIRGIATVSKATYADPTAKEGDWSSVELKADKTLLHPVTLAAIKTDRRLKNMLLLKISRLSVMPVQQEEYEALMEMAG